MAYRPTDRTLARAELRRADIVDAATMLISTDGFRAATVRAIADNSGIAIGTVYRYFGNREELLATIFRTLASREYRAVERAVTAAGPGVPAQLTALLTTFSRRALSNPRTAEALLFEPVNALVEAERMTFRRRFHDLMVGVITDGIARGDIPDQDAITTARAVIGANAEALMGRLSPPPSTVATATAAPSAPSTDELITTVTTFCLRALGAQP
ncbi:TetR/AcrR family transcriptional regulator [Corynebacterium terpenotabidum]|uniref:TetR family transcriptional regulator n=1 Tax=Corynebacterium terpenotabidum Y-11 TaxID=1200352 RepID=S4XMU3_9CORY|nr:TetR/AcrR family transcriptional regulator [Corynebacterium terpenotabidum]AGP31983.1 TetR family transcriptional regulator [Corynebacterium terpenotabidum Y-11]